RGRTDVRVLPCHADGDGNCPKWPSVHQRSRFLDRNLIWPYDLCDDDGHTLLCRRGTHHLCERESIDPVTHRGIRTANLLPGLGRLLLASREYGSQYVSGDRGRNGHLLASRGGAADGRILASLPPRPPGTAPNRIWPTVWCLVPA